jgi:Putative zinc-finger
MSRHVSAEKLARFRDGDLGSTAARRVTAHLAACPACQADADALAGLPALLASAEVPPIPEYLAARIEGALAAESALRAAGSPAARPAATGHRRAGRRSGTPRWVVSGEQAQHHARRPGPARRILVAAAAVAIVGGGGYALASSLGSGASTSSSASSPAGRPARAPAAAGPAAAPAARPTASGLHNLPDSSAGARPGVTGAPDFGPEQQLAGAGQAGTFTPVRTSTAYTAGQLGQQAAAILAAIRGAPPAHAGGGRSSGGASTGAGTAGAFSAATLSQLRGCVGRVAAGQSVLLVDLASFAGGPATIIVTAPPGSARATQVWAVGPGCSSTAADVLAHQQVP